MGKQKLAHSTVSFTSFLFAVCVWCFALEAQAADETLSKTNPVAEDVLPTPTLGDDTLPVPSTKEEDSKFQVNKENLEDDIYLPAPSMQDTTVAPPQRYATGGGGVINTDYDQNASTVSTRPAFSIGAGGAFRSYPSPLVLEQKQGLYWDTSLRVFSISDTAFLHLFASYSYIQLGNLNDNDAAATNLFQALKETVLTYGPIVEIGVGRRLSLMAGLLHRSSTMTADLRKPSMTEAEKINILSNIAQKPSWNLGIGGQYDFVVIPHGSMGVRGYIESGLYTLGVVFSVEPAPRQKLTLDQSELE